MADFPGRWWLGGGWAIDVRLGGASRAHEDIEICVLRSDQDLLRTYCAGWQFLTWVDNTLVPVAEHERLLFPRFQLQLQSTTATPVSVAGMPPEWEFILNDVVDGQWLFLPESSIRLPIDRVYAPSPLGLPVVTPEIPLFFKAWFAPHRPKDEHDFQRVRNHLRPDQQSWLVEHLEQFRPDEL